MTVIEKMMAVLPSASVRLQEIPCPPAGKTADLPTCLLLYEPTKDISTDTMLSSLNRYYAAFRWYVASKLVKSHDKKLVRDALRQHLRRDTGREPKENLLAPQIEHQADTVSVPFIEPEDHQDISDKNITPTDDSLKREPGYLPGEDGPCEGKCLKYKSGAADVPQRGRTSIVNQTPQYPITECEELAEEETRFRNGMKKNVEELVQLSEIANTYLQESPPTIDRSTSPSQMFSAISLARRQMKEGMEILEAFKHLRLQRRGLTEQLETKLAVAENWVRAYDESVAPQGETVEDEPKDGDRESRPDASTPWEEQAETEAEPQTDPADSADEATSSDESFYRGLQDSSASVDGDL
ncbi:hypothetical protein FS837_012028 [Tulasnella sp. UAMH 9824]|nr:hypothetical protein FS837_012028 [Tulasnella sp. UAMH 9824]